MAYRFSSRSTTPGDWAIVPAAVALLGGGGSILDEATRNTNPGVINVRRGTGYKILNTSYVGTYGVPAGDPSVWTWNPRTDIANAIRDELNAHAFSPTFVAVSSYVPSFDLKDMTALHVTVVPNGLDLTTICRGLTQGDLTIDVAVQQKLTTDDLSEIDALMELVQDIMAFLVDTKEFGYATLLSIANSPIYSAEHLKDMRMFTSVVTLTLRAMMP